MKRNAHASILFCLVLVAGCRTLAADDYYTSRGHSPYPPGCVTLPSSQSDLYGENIAQFWSGSLELENVHKVESRDPAANRSPVDVAMYRVGCAEPGRSVILVVFRLPTERASGGYPQLVLPTFTGNTAMDPVRFDLKPEPNGWGEDVTQNLLTKRTFGDYSDGWFDAGFLAWTYILDIGPDGRYWPSPFLVEYYNSRFALEMFIDGEWTGYIDVPATTKMLAPSSTLPLNGRLSGTWVEPGASDQGFLLSFGNPVPPAGDTEERPERPDLVAFLTWYTFDREGEQLWLAGDARFPQGADEVVMPLVRVNGGRFLGPESAGLAGESPREQVGTLRLKSLGCNALVADYELESLGLGAGSIHLRRLGVLETAGYPCRDYEARLADLSSGPTR